MAKESKPKEKNETKNKENEKVEQAKTEQKVEAKKDAAEEIKEKALSAFNILAQKTKEQVAKAQELAEKHQVKEKFVKGLVNISSKLNEKALELEKKVITNKDKSEDKSKEK